MPQQFFSESVSRKLISQAEYIRQIKPLLPDGVFRPRTDKLLVLAAHTLVVLGGMLSIRYFEHWLVLPLAALVIGHSMSCVAFVAHDLSHNSVVRNRRLRYSLELYSWGLLLVPTTLWHHLHNQTHHRFANSPNDPDRRFLSSEKTSLSNLYDRLFIPSRNSRRGNLVPLAFFAYMIRALIAAFFYREQKKPSFVTHNPEYTVADRLRIVFEIVVSLVIQVGIFYLAGGEVVKYIFASLIPLVLVTTLLISYIVTNHFLNPATELNDALVNSTSVEVHPVIDWVHQHFSHHTEHHIFPSMSSIYYPLVRQALKEKYPERFNCLRFSEATRRVWSAERFIDSPAETMLEQPHPKSNPI